MAEAENDQLVSRAYGLMAMTDHVWSRFAAQEVDSLLKFLSVVPTGSNNRVTDMGCGSGRHAVELAARGFKVRAFDYVQEWIAYAQKTAASRSAEISEAKGEFKAELADARNPPSLEAADLVLCLYDVIGSSDVYEDAQSIIDGLFRSCRPGGYVVIGCMSGTQLLRGLPPDRFITHDVLRDELQPVSAMQNCGEIFDFSKMFYNVTTGVLFRREQFSDNGTIVLDSVLRERRYLPSEIREMLIRAGFQPESMHSIRAGRWDFTAPFDAAAPEILYFARRPEEVLESLPRIRSPQQFPKSKSGYTLLTIPRKEITVQHAAVVSRIFCTSFGKNPKTGRNHVLGPARMFARLQKCQFLCLVLKGDLPVGYMFGTAYDHLLTTIAWLDSICVIKEFRRQGLATAMLDAFTRAVPKFEWLGATSPNPITKLVLEKIDVGRIYGPGEPAPAEIIDSLEFIKHECEDLKSCQIDGQRMLIQTKFNVAYDDRERQWQGNGGSNQSHSEPAWWTTLANLPEDFESLLLIHREARHRLERQE